MTQECMVNTHLPKAPTFRLQPIHAQPNLHEIQQPKLLVVPRGRHPQTKKKELAVLNKRVIERRTEWRMEADRLERGLAGREVRFLPDSYLLDPLFPCSCLRLNDTSRKQTTGRTRAGVDAREGTGAEATGIGQRVGRLGNYLEKVTDARNRDSDLRYRE
ncbi:unnamed protein product [Sphenostylis stenocarpa]|uniref:Uncharacterized protein n=1 Tax=Sphenostylis stenocarpa TaxID=92480 RepID=A0AA86VTZ2_9FABA|nr:unnamed protein product [Sphenostylis stenocarpa]